MRCGCLIHSKLFAWLAGFQGVDGPPEPSLPDPALHCHPRVLGTTVLCFQVTRCCLLLCDCSIMVNGRGTGVGLKPQGWCMDVCSRVKVEKLRRSQKHGWLGGDCAPAYFPRRSHRSRTAGVLRRCSERMRCSPVDKFNYNSTLFQNAYVIHALVVTARPSRVSQVNPDLSNTRRKTYVPHKSAHKVRVSYK